jgi:hypothetical protein
MFSCERCLRNFDRKESLIRHLNKKTDCYVGEGRPSRSECIDGLSHKNEIHELNIRLVKIESDIESMKKEIGLKNSGETARLEKIDRLGKFIKELRRKDPTLYNKNYKLFKDIDNAIQSSKMDKNSPITDLEEYIKCKINLFDRSFG